MVSQYLSLLALPVLAAAQKCALQFDGRIPSNFSLAAFDSNNNIYNPSNVFGKSKSLLKKLNCAHN